MLQPGNEVAAVWRGRLDEHLGTIGCELLRAHAARFLDDSARLAGLTSAAALAMTTLPEREPHQDVYASFARLLAALDSAAGGVVAVWGESPAMVNGNARTKRIEAAPVSRMMDHS